MLSIYGHKWLSNFGDKDDGTWLAGLRGVTNEMLGHGLSECVTERTDSWPPSLPEFRNMCLGTIEQKEAVGMALDFANNDYYAKALRKSVSTFDLNNCSTDQLRERFNVNFKKVQSDAINRTLKSEYERLGVENVKILS